MSRRCGYYVIFPVTLTSHPLPPPTIFLSNFSIFPRSRTSRNVQYSPEIEREPTLPHDHILKVISLLHETEFKIS